MKLLITVAALLSLAAVTQSKFLCRDLPTNISDDARIFLEPYGSRWQIQKTNVNKTGDQTIAKIRNCLNGLYIGNRDGHPDRATIIFINRKLGFHSVAKEIVDDNMSRWTLYTDDGLKKTKTVYRKLVIKSDGKNSYFGLYSCYPDGIYIQDIMLVAMTDKGAEAMDKEIEESFPKLPLRPEQELRKVFVNCGNSKPRC